MTDKNRTDSVYKLKSSFLLTLLASLLFLISSAQAAPTRTTRITVVRGGRVAPYTVQMYGLLMVKADGSQAGAAPGTTTLTGNVVITAAHPQGALHLSGERAIVETQLIELQLGSDVEPANQDQALFSTIKALKGFPLVPRFRISWSISMMGASTGCTVLYNRRLQTLRYLEQSFYNSGMSVDSALYTHVTDSVLRRAASNATQAGVGSFPTVSSYGATKRVANSRSHNHRVI